MTSQLSFLHDTLKVDHLENNQVQVTVVLPSDLLIHYVTILDSLTGFVRTLQIKSKLLRLKQSPQTSALREQARHSKDQYYARIVKLFDHYTSQGLNRNSAIKQIGSDLRKEKHPWSSPDLVRFSLRDAGRGGRVGRPRKTS